MTLAAQLKTLWCFTLILLSSLSADAAEICLKAEHRCPGPLVRLGDVADVRDKDAVRAEKLAQIELFPAPGRARVLRQRELEELLTLASAGVLRFSGEASVTIYPAEGKPAATPAPPSKPAAKTPRTRRESVPPKMVVVTLRPLRKGEVLQTADIDLKPANNLVQAAFFTADEVLGKETTRALATGQVLEPDHVRPPVLVNKGDVVRVIAKAAGVRVKTNGRALADGGHGDLVEVQQIDGKQRYTARVVDYQQVEIYAQGPSAE